MQGIWVNSLGLILHGEGNINAHAYMSSKIIEPQ